MKAYVVRAFGETGSVEELPVPQAGNGEVLVRIRAAGVVPMDSVAVMGLYKDFMEHRLPLIPGLDGAGVVESVGTGVEGFSVGDAVFGTSAKPFLGEGTYAQYATMPVVGLVKRPASVDVASAAALPNGGTTALAVIDAVEAGPGKTILIVGATGGVGSYATQLAARRGAHVVAVSLPDYAVYARELGAAETVDYTLGDLVDLVRANNPDGVDGIIDLASDGAGLAKLAALVRKGGRVVSTLNAADVDGLAARGIVGVNAMGGPQRLAEVAGMLERGEIRSPAIRTMPLGEAATALSEQAGRHVRGRLVLLVD